MDPAKLQRLERMAGGEAVNLDSEAQPDNTGLWNTLRSTDSYDDLLD